MGCTHLVEIDFAGSYDSGEKPAPSKNLQCELFHSSAGEKNNKNHR